VLRRRIAALEDALSAKERELDTVSDRLRATTQALTALEAQHTQQLLLAARAAAPPPASRLAASPVGDGGGEQLTRVAAVLQLGLHRCYDVRVFTREQCGVH
jgi:hypothetical protein